MSGVRGLSVTSPVERDFVSALVHVQTRHLRLAGVGVAPPITNLASAVLSRALVSRPSFQANVSIVNVVACVSRWQRRTAHVAII